MTSYSAKASEAFFAYVGFNGIDAFDHYVEADVEFFVVYC